MLKGRSRLQRGETLIELLLAFAILSLALVTVMRTMNGGFGSLFVSGQRSQVESQMRGQLAILQSAHQQAVANPSGTEAANWNAIVASIGADPLKAVDADGCAYTSQKNRLYFAAGSGTSWTGTVGVRSTGALTTSTETPTPNGNTLWIEARHTPKKDFARGYYDFYIKSCWDGDGSVRQQAKMVTRFYDLDAPAAPAYDNMSFVASSTGCANSTPASNPKISYVLSNPNNYPMGNVSVYVNSVLLNTHQLNSSQTINYTTPAGYGGGQYDLTAVLDATGAVVARQVTIPLCPIDIRGSEYNAGQCRPLYDYEGQEWNPRPTYAFLSNPGPYSYPCQTFPSYGTVYTCVNYDVNYPSRVTVAGAYRMTLSYLDANCGDASNETMNVTGYYYRVDVYRNSIYAGTMSLSPGAPILDATFNFPVLNPGDTIGFRWSNNRFINPGMRDPDLVIYNIRLEK